MKFESVLFRASLKTKVMSSPKAVIFPVLHLKRAISGLRQGRAGKILIGLCREFLKANCALQGTRDRLFSSGLPRAVCSSPLKHGSFSACLLVAATQDEKLNYREKSDGSSANRVNNYSVGWGGGRREGRPT